MDDENMPSLQVINFMELCRCETNLRNAALNVQINTFHCLKHK